MAVHFLKASPFDKNRLRIEDFIFCSIVELQSDVEAAIRGVDNFAKAIDKFIDTTEKYCQYGFSTHFNTIDSSLSVYIAFKK